MASPRTRRLRRSVFATRRRLSGEAPTVHYFHQPDDPYSHLAAQTLAAFGARYDVSLKIWLVPPPDDAAAPQRARLEAFALRDAALVARRFGLSYPATIVAPSTDARADAASALAAALARGAFAEIAPQVGTALWSGAPVDPALPRASAAEVADAARAGAAMRGKFGHYLGAMFYFEGEWYWGVDRLHHLERRLAEMGLDRAPGAPLAPYQRETAAPAGQAAGAVIDYWFSFRSPYSYIALPRAIALARAYGAELRLRYILPMVMRGLPVPAPKQLYIMRDCKREAEMVGLPFGKTVDPVGTGVERALAVLHRAVGIGAGEAFAVAALEGSFSRGIDLSTDKGLFGVARAAGLRDTFVRAALADESWRPAAEANRAALFEAGLWGAPTFRLNGGAAHWGQDRLWALEEELAALAGR